MNVQRLEDIKTAFMSPPAGATPIVPILKTILKQQELIYEGRIIMIATDGEPTDERNYVNIPQLKQVLVKERAYNDYISFLACTDDDSAIAYLNKWDKDLPRLDVTDDYLNEKKEVLAAQGRNFSFTYGDYVVKTMLGSVVPEIDRLDEIHYDDCKCNIL